jgi:lipopolysaccharide assembly outer membrane protein LptD (OstA)
MFMKSLDLSTRLILGAAVATILGGCGVAQQAGEDAARAVLEKSKKEVKKNVAELGNLLSSGATLSGHDEKGRFIWSVGAKKIQIHDQQEKDGKVIKPRSAELVDARATLYREGKAHSTFKAPKMELVYAPEGVMMTLSGGVAMRTPGTSPSKNIKPQDEKARKIQKAISERGVVELRSPLVNVDVKKRELRASKGIVMTQGTTRVEAKQLFADTDLAVARVDGQVKATAPQGTISAPRATWKWKAGQMNADGGVTLVHDKTTLTGARLVADTNAQSGSLEGGARAQSPQGNATASRVLYNWKNNTISARDGVSMQDSEGGTMRAARLDTDDKFNQITASGDVTLQKDGGTLRASNVTAYDKLSRVTASGGVTIEKDNQTLRASGVTAYDKFARAVAEGGVVLTRPDATLRAASAEAWLKEKRATGRGVTVTRGDVTVRAGQAELANAGGDSAQIVATGDVRASSPQGNVRASRVTWGGGRVVGSGGVTLQKDGNSIRGDRLESDDKFQNATLSGDVNGRMANGQTVAAGVVNLRGDTLLAENGVTGRRGNVRLQAAKLEATRNGRNVVLTGGVTLRSDDGVVAKAPAARYDRVAGKIYASGGVTISDPERGEQHGRTLVADLNLKQATLTEVRGNFSEKLFKNRKLF